MLAFLKLKSTLVMLGIILTSFGGLWFSVSKYFEERAQGKLKVEAFNNMYDQWQTERDKRAALDVAQAETRKDFTKAQRELNEVNIDELDSDTLIDALNDYTRRMLDDLETAANRQRDSEGIR